MLFVLIYVTRYDQHNYFWYIRLYPFTLMYNTVNLECEIFIQCVELETKLFGLTDCWCTPFTYGDWHTWSSCSQPCGGGTRKRVRYSCVQNDEDWQSDDCNEFCYNGGSYVTKGYCRCNSWRSGTCCRGWTRHYL